MKYSNVSTMDHSEIGVFAPSDSELGHQFGCLHSLNVVNIGKPKTMIPNSEVYEYPQNIPLWMHHILIFPWFSQLRFVLWSGVSDVNVGL